MSENRHTDEHGVVHEFRWAPDGRVVYGWSTCWLPVAVNWFPLRKLNFPPHKEAFKFGLAWARNTCPGHLRVNDDGTVSTLEQPSELEASDMTVKLKSLLKEAEARIAELEAELASVSETAASDAEERRKLIAYLENVLKVRGEVSDGLFEREIKAERERDQAEEKLSRVTDALKVLTEVSRGGTCTVEKKTRHTNTYYCSRQIPGRFVRVRVVETEIFPGEE